MKKIIHIQELKEIIYNVLSELSLTVGNTMGYFGKNVIIQKQSGTPYTTKDGVSVIRAIEYDSKPESIITDIVKDVARRVVNECGDGTTTSVILTEAIYRHGYKYLNQDKNITEIKTGMEKAVEYVQKYINSNKFSVDYNSEDLKNVAFISANGDMNIADMIVSTIDEVGADGIIIVTENKSTETEVEITQGFQLDAGMVTKEFLSEEQADLTFKDALIVITSFKLTKFMDYIPILEYAHKEKKSVLFFAPDFSAEFINYAVINFKQRGLNVCAIKLPFRGEVQYGYSEDLALLASAKILDSNFVIDPTLPLQNIGYITEVIVKKDVTVITEIDIEKVEFAILKRIEYIKKELNDCENELLRDHFQKRISKLSGGFANIKVGSASQIELLEKKDRIEDALNAVKSAIEDGIVPGGGIMFLKASHELQRAKLGLKGDEALGVDIIINSLKEPFIRLMTNAGLDYKQTMDVIVKDKRITHGYDLRIRKITNLYKSGVIDPAKVLKSVLKNSLSTASMLLSTSDMVIDDKMKVSDVM